MTILEVLYNAQINLTENINSHLGRIIGQQQLSNAITLFEKGYLPEDDYYEILGDLENTKEVPNKQK